MRLSNFIAPGITLALFICGLLLYYLLKDDIVSRSTAEEWYPRVMWFFIGGVAASFVEGLVSGGPRR